MSISDDPWRAQPLPASPLSRPISQPSNLPQIDHMLHSKSSLEKQLLEINSHYVDIDSILDDETLSDDKKRHNIQTLLWAYSTNGSSTDELLSRPASNYLNLDAFDSSNNNSTALIYASCFGNKSIANALLKNGASTDLQDNFQWTALMWAINNHHDTIAQLLVDYGASVDIESDSGTSALTLMAPGSSLYSYFSSRGYFSSPDFYDDGHNPLAPTSIDLDESSDMHHRMLLESAYNLNVNMDHLKINDIDPEDSIDDSLNHGSLNLKDDFVWDRCKPDQMFVFAEGDIPRILDLSITEMEPKRTKGQKPVPADILFLSARYAHYYGSPETVDNLLYPACSRIRSLVMNKKDDIAFLAFWLSNCSLLLYYLRKDPGVLPATTHHQRSLAQLITDTTILIAQDAERRLDIVLDASILDHETIPGLDDILFQSDWRFFKKSKKKNKTHEQQLQEKYGLPTMSAKMKPSPRNVVSILNSVLFVCDLYGIHPIIVQELLSQLIYWLGAVLFNRIMSNRKYLARSRAMQIRLNVSAIEDWAQQNNRQPEDTVSEFGHLQNVKKYPSVVQLCHIHLAPLVQLLQWLQIFTGFGATNDDAKNINNTNTTLSNGSNPANFSNVVSTLQQLTALNPTQLLHVAKKYRPEVGEKGLSKEYKQYLSNLNLHYRNEHSHFSKVISKPIHKMTLTSGKVDLEKGENESQEKEEPESETERRKSVENEVPKIIERKTDDSNNKIKTEENAEGTDGNEKDGTKKEIEQEDAYQEKEQEDDSLDYANKQANSSAPILPSPSVVSPSSLFLNDELSPIQPSTPTSPATNFAFDSGSAPLELYMDASAVLPFIVPTLTEMVFVWGHGLGGTRHSHAPGAQIHVPALPMEFLDKLEEAIGTSTYTNVDSYDDDYNSTENGGVDTNEEVEIKKSINPIFAGVAVPEPSAHKMWGDDDEPDEFKSVW